MRLNDERAREARRRVEEARIRRIVREEIVAALQVLGRAASHEGNLTESEIAERAAGVFEAVAESAVIRLTCPHEKYSQWWGASYCARCGEPEPEPVNPFEPEGKARVCPVEPEACGPITGWEAFLEHIYEVHTEDGKGYDRHEVVQRLLEQGGNRG